MYEVLADNEATAVKISQRVPDEPRIGFALGLVVLVVLVALAIGART
jgi:hypothetical protein